MDIGCCFQHHPSFPPVCIHRWLGFWQFSLALNVVTHFPSVAHLQTEHRTDVPCVWDILLCVLLLCEKKSSMTVPTITQRRMTNGLSTLEHNGKYYFVFGAI